MQTIQLEVRDDYTDKILDFLKLLPENVAKIKVSSRNEYKEEELISRIDDIKNNKVKTISRDELFEDL
ncbi:MAG: hypothetical protein U9Q04_00405 [Campylobacterota bacterium]|nr:hypothetical protein [Campylobacterota bacterium]